MPEAASSLPSRGEGSGRVGGSTSSISTTVPCRWPERSPGIGESRSTCSSCEPQLPRCRGSPLDGQLCPLERASLLPVGERAGDGRDVTDPETGWPGTRDVCDYRSPLDSARQSPPDLRHDVPSPTFPALLGIGLAAGETVLTSVCLEETGSPFGGHVVGPRSLVAKPSRAVGTLESHESTGK